MKQERSTPVAAPRLVRCSSFMEVDRQLESLRKDVNRLWRIVGVMVAVCLILAVDSWVQGDLIRRLSNPRHHEEAPQTRQGKSPIRSRTSTSSKEDESPHPKAVLAVLMSSLSAYLARPAQLPAPSDHHRDRRLPSEVVPPSCSKNYVELMRSPSPKRFD